MSIHILCSISLRHVNTKQVPDQYLCLLETLPIQSDNSATKMPNNSKCGRVANRKHFVHNICKQAKYLKRQ